MVEHKRESANSDAMIRPRYTCCHPNATGTGACVRFELHPAHGYVEGSVFATFASQKTIGSYANGEMIPSTFDWANGVTIRLTINEVAEILEVFRGYRERLGDEKGLFHRSAKGNTVITLEHRLEPSPGYLFGVSKKGNDGKLSRINILLCMTEMIVLSEALASSMLYMAFGVPKVIQRADAQARKTEAADRVKEVA
ncbi:MAG: hypothetical protein J6R18_07585 [Kiritimatiellae bacterium]|nr:hypothetical protein [Kiritimatiellia bacterium]